MFRFLLITFLLSISATYASADEKRINFIIKNKLFADSAVNKSVDEVATLLKQSFLGWSVTINQSTAKINIRLEIVPIENNSTQREFPSSINYPVQFYIWKSKPSKEGFALSLTAPNKMGIVFGLYGFLQEKLGFRFYHPKNTFIPKHANWPLPNDFNFTGKPKFEKRGFHLHTMHPMELTEQLHSSMDGTAIDDVKEYIDWLVHTGQNVMQFWLLRTVDKDAWPAYATEYVNYAKSRGILIGTVISLSTLQQKAFQTMNILNPMNSYTRQIDNNIKWLLQVPFDFVSIDFTMGEYLPDLSTIMPEKKKYLIQTIKDKYGINVMENTHVIKRDELTSPECAGKVIHSVMFYSITEDDAPVYGNKNQKFMFDMMKQSKMERETWYWPESSYWVTFDTSVPLFLLPYLKSRHDDITNIGDLGIDGHVTFTSGWEWGYWVIDYSIANWSWAYATDGNEKTTSPTSVLAELFGDESSNLFFQALAVQEKYLKNKKLITLLSAKTPFEELPWPFNKSFQPTGDYSMLRAAVPFLGKSDRINIETDANLLIDFHDELSDIVSQLKDIKKSNNTVIAYLRDEIIRSLEITALRAQHRHYTLLAGAYRNYRLKDSSKYYLSNLLLSAKNTRYTAMNIVKSMESEYRYPIALIARKMHGHTSYDFGYLYPVSDLFFWKREEQQVTGQRFDAFYMNLWNFWDTLGLDGLF
ncbi:MAG: hypothetical protein C0603_07075 [Denitrovibrio sp.]|nr:MAG: hypothetical protein C0603_07075 [Denitrovibrio sp.]